MEDVLFLSTTNVLRYGTRTTRQRKSFCEIKRYRRSWDVDSWTLLSYVDFILTWADCADCIM